MAGRCFVLAVTGPTSLIPFRLPCRGISLSQSVSRRPTGQLAELRMRDGAYPIPTSSSDLSFVKIVQGSEQGEVQGHIPDRETTSDKALRS